MCKLISTLDVVNTFRIFIDLQSFDMCTIPPSFLNNYCVRFMLTESNNEDMEGFNDVWANILNGDIINNSENISEHPSLLIKKLDAEKGDLSVSNQLMGDISVIKQEDSATNQVNQDVSKEEGQILKEINEVLSNSAGEHTERVMIQDQQQVDKTQDNILDGDLEEHKSLEVEVRDDKIVKDSQNLDAAESDQISGPPTLEGQPNSKQPVKDAAMRESKPDTLEDQNESKEDL